MKDSPEKNTSHSKKDTSSNGFGNLTTTLLYISVTIFFAGIVFGGGDMDFPSLFTKICMISACLLMGIDGVIVMILREAPRPGFSSIKGISAILSGLGIVITFGCAGVFLIWLLISGK